MRIAEINNHTQGEGMSKDKLKWAAIGLAVGIIGGGIGADTMT